MKTGKWQAISKIVLRFIDTDRPVCALIALALLITPVATGVVVAGRLANTWLSTR